MNNRFCIFLLSFLFCVSNTLLPLDRQSTQAAAVDSADVVVDTSGNVYHMVYVRASAQFGITKTDINGNLVQGFGVNGLQTLVVSASATPSSGAMINISGGAISLEANQKAVLALSPNNDLFLGFAVEVNGLKRICVVKLSGSTGAIDTSFGTSGIILNGVTGAGYAFDYASYTLEDMTIDSSGRPITLLRLRGMEGSVALVVSRFTTGTNVIYLGVAFSSPGCSVITDVANNVYVVGQQSGAFFSLKFNASDLSTNNSYGVAGRAMTANMGLDNNSAVFTAIEGGSVQIFGLRAVKSEMATVIFNSFGSVPVANSATVFPSDAVLKSVIRRSDGKIYLAGTILSGGSQTTFLGRLSSALVGDVTFAQSGQANYLSDGIVKILPSSGFTVASGQGGWLGFDDVTNTVAVVFAETNGLTTQLTRDFGIEAGQFLTAPETPIVPSAATSAPRARVQNRGKTDAGFNRNTFGGSNVAAIQDAGVLVNADDDVITYFRSGDNFVLSMSNETDGSLATGFASSGSRLIKVRPVGANTSTVAIANFTGITANKSAYIAYDSRSGNEKIVMAFQVNLSTGNKQIVVIRLDKTTGLLDSGFGTAGVATIADSNLVHQLDALAVDSTGRVVVLTYREENNSKFPVVYRFADNGTLDGAFGTSGVKSLGSSSPSVNNAISGLDLALSSINVNDPLSADDDIFVVGKYGASSSYGFFCIKLDASTGAINMNFGEGDGIYNRASITELTTTSRVFCKFQSDQDGGDSNYNLKIFSQGTSGGAAGIVMVKLKLSSDDNGYNGREASGFTVVTSAPGVVGFVAITNLTKLNQFLRNNDKRDVCTGTITDVGTVKIFIASIKSDGTLNTKYGDTVDGSQTGITILTATGGIIQDGGWASRDTGEAAPIVWIEQDGGTRRLILERISTDDTVDSVIVASTTLATDLVNHQQSYMLDSSRLYANLGIARHLIELRKALDADASPHLTTTVKDRAVRLFDEAIKTILQAKISSASSNGLRSGFKEKHKTGSMNKQMHDKTKSTANFTSNEQAAIAPHIAVRMNLIFGQLDTRKTNVTGETTSN